MDGLNIFIAGVVIGFTISYLIFTSKRYFERTAKLKTHFFGALNVVLKDGNSTTYTIDVGENLDNLNTSGIALLEINVSDERKEKK